MFNCLNADVVSSGEAPLDFDDQVFCADQIGCWLRIKSQPTLPSTDTDRFFSADHLTEIGKAASSAAPITVAPINTDLRLEVLNTDRRRERP
jgi:hypothetical protein